MGTKMKSNGDGSIKILAHSTTVKKGKLEIVKPEKVLRENLQAEKEIYEGEGWSFVLNSETAYPDYYLAENPSPVFPKLRDKKLSEIFKFIEVEKDENDGRIRQFIQNDRQRFDWLELPRDWQTEKETLEADGWIFIYYDDASEWSAGHPEHLGATGVNSFGSLLRIVRRNIKNTADAAASQEKSPVIAGEINLSEIVPSPFEGQKRRRDRFTDEEISELAGSIKAHGVLQPIVVRPSRKLARTNSNPIYEIIAGERRFLAAEKAGLATIPAVNRNVSDEVAFEIQTIENLQRKDPDPIDEAFSYAEYIEKYGRTVEDLTVKFGKPLKFIAGRLRLTKLIPEAVKDIADGFLPLGHAFEIAKLAPEIQTDALSLCYSKSWQDGAYVADKTKPRTLLQLRSDIEKDIFLSLGKAKFSLTATNLRDDGLPCVKCPQRTGATGNLFEEMHDPENDRCLNSFCFAQKTSCFVQTARSTRSAEMVAAGLALGGYQMPIISWQRHNRERVEKHFGESPLTDGEYSPINNNTGECDAMEFGIFVDDGGRFGETIKFCRSLDCAKHKKFISSAQSASSDNAVPGEKTDKEKREFYKRKQEIFDIKVGEPVRKKVLAEAAKKFCADNWVFDNEKWRRRLVERIWSRIDDNARQLITEALGREKHSIRESTLKTLSADDLSKILFLSIIANEGEMLWGSWCDQKEIIAVADEFGVDYALADAKERAACAPKKFKDAATEHLAKIERGEKVDRPTFYKLEK